MYFVLQILLSLILQIPHNRQCKYSNLKVTCCVYVKDYKLEETSTYIHFYNNIMIIVMNYSSVSFSLSAI